MATPALPSLNGKQCCVLDLPCCIPPPGMTRAEAQHAKLSGFFREAAPELDGSTADNLATALLANVGLVAHGVDKAIHRGYARHLTGPATPAAAG